MFVVSELGRCSMMLNAFFLFGSWENKSKSGQGMAFVLVPRFQTFRSRTSHLGPVQSQRPDAVQGQGYYGFLFSPYLSGGRAQE